MNNRSVRVVFESETEGVYRQLLEAVAEEKKKGITNSDNQRLLKSIDYKVELLKMNSMAGIQIQRKSIPKTYLHKYENR